MLHVKLTVYYTVSFTCNIHLLNSGVGGWSGGAMVLGNLTVPGRPTNLD